MTFSWSAVSIALVTASVILAAAAAKAPLPALGPPPSRRPRICPPRSRKSPSLERVLQLRLQHQTRCAMAAIAFIPRCLSSPGTRSEARATVSKAGSGANPSGLPRPASPGERSRRQAPRPSPPAQRGHLLLGLHHGRVCRPSCCCTTSSDTPPRTRTAAPPPMMMFRFTFFTFPCLPVFSHITAPCPELLILSLPRPV